MSGIGRKSSAVSNLLSRYKAGNVNAKLDSDMAARDFQAWMRKPLADLELEKRVSVLPSVIVDGAVVILQGLPDGLMGCSALTRQRGIGLSWRR